MKVVTFIRHYRLAYPFDSKENTDHEQYVNLSKGLIDPSINSDVKNYITNELDLDAYKQFDVIISSPSKRTLESANEVKKVFNLNIKIETCELLEECAWNPDLPGERINRFIDGTELSTLKDTWERIKELDKYLKGLSYNNMLCVTHSFFMQILYLYYSGSFKNYKDIKYEDIKSSFHGEYLKGFDVNYPDLGK
ncbi:histidine phosphatase family protein [candidate division WWE3 bacterium]|uniref:Histidine phosphatase family protein n=1 Tax=candidate division WWE3 bacterium TaxID=2053526 RepID=A0A7X9E6V0_UNCKA|nr:histidine phosphatase family protein [candidate division WWE3 bacterium]